MAGLGIAIAWFGYWVLYYGVTQIQGDNYGFLDLGVPGRWAKAAATPPDSPTSAAAGTGANNGTPVTSGNVSNVPITDTNNGLSIGAPAGNTPNPVFSAPTPGTPS